MPKNNELRAVLESLRFLETKPAKARDEALKALFDAGVDPHAFQQALVAHRAFWWGIPSLTEPGLEGDDARIQRYFGEGFIDPDERGRDSIAALHQILAKQKVMLALKDASLEDLHALIVNDQETCRAFLATKPNLGGVNSSPLWKADEPRAAAAAGEEAPPAPKNKSTEVLSDAAIEEIKTLAMELFYVRQLNNAKRLEVLEELAVLNGEALGDKLASFGLPRIIAFTPAMGTALVNRIRVLRRERAFELFKEQVDEWTKETLLAQGALFQGEDEAFRAHWVRLNPDSGLNMGHLEVNAARGYLISKYLLALLPTASRDRAAVLQARTAAELNNALATILGYPAAPAYWNGLFESSVASIKMSALEGWILGLSEEQLTELSRATHLLSFKEVLTRLGMNNHDWIKNKEQFKEIKTWVLKSKNTLAFTQRLNAVSRLSGAAHPKLIEAFRKLDAAQQEKILAHADRDLPLLLNARTENAVEYFLGKNAWGVEAVLQENKRLASFRKIQNPEIAKGLAFLQPNAAELTDVEIRAINAAIRDWGEAVNYAMGYPRLAEEISRQAKVDGNSDSFLAFFGGPFSGDEQAQANYRAMEAAQVRNTPLLSGYGGARNQALYELFLRLDLGAETLSTLLRRLNNALEADALEPGRMPEHIRTEFSKISAYLLSCVSVTEFIEALCGPDAGNAELLRLKNRLRQELSPEAYLELRSAELALEFRDPLLHDQGMAHVRTHLDQMRADHTRLIQESEQLLADVRLIRPIHLFNPLFQNMQGIEAKKQLQEMEDSNALCMDKLRRDIAVLRSYLRLTRAGENAPETLLGALHLQLAQECFQAEEALNNYKEIQERTAKILADIDEALAADARVYKRLGIAISYHKKEEKLKSYPFKKQTKSADAAVAIQGIKKLPFGMERKLAAGEVRVYDVAPPSELSRLAPNAVYKPSQLHGQFIEERSEDEAKLKKGEVESGSAGRFQIKLFPQPVPGGSEEELEQARVNFCMCLAVQVFASMGGTKPSASNPIVLSGADPEQLKYLWTALVQVGESQDRKFKTNFIRVDSPNFNPKAEKEKRFFGVVNRYTEHSHYKKIFSKPECRAIVKEYTKHIKDLKSEAKKFKSVGKKRVKEEKKLDSTTQKFRDLNQAQKNARKRMEEEGPAPAPARRKSR